RRLGPDGVHAQDLVVAAFGHDLDEPVGPARRDGQAVAPQGEDADLDLVAFFPGLGLRQPHRRHLGVAVGGAGDLAVVQRPHRTPGDGFGGQDALLAGDVGQERRAGDVADGVNRSEEHTSELQSRENLVCRLLLEKKTRDLTYEAANLTTPPNLILSGPSFHCTPARTMEVYASILQTWRHATDESAELPSVRPLAA